MRKMPKNFWRPVFVVWRSQKRPPNEYMGTAARGASDPGPGRVSVGFGPNRRSATHRYPGDPVPSF